MHLLCRKVNFCQQVSYLYLLYRLFIKVTFLQKNNKTWLLGLFELGPGGAGSGIHGLGEQHCKGVLEAPPKPPLHGNLKGYRRNLINCSMALKCQLRYGRN